MLHQVTQAREKNAAKSQLFRQFLPIDPNIRHHSISMRFIQFSIFSHMCYQTGYRAFVNITSNHKCVPGSISKHHKKNWPRQFLNDLSHFQRTIQNCASYSGFCCADSFVCKRKRFLKRKF